MEKVVPGTAPRAPGILAIPGRKPRMEQRPRRRSHRHRSDLHTWNCWAFGCRLPKLPRIPASCRD